MDVIRVLIMDDTPFFDVAFVDSPDATPGHRGHR